MPAERVVFGGDSAGGALVVAVMVAARDKGLPLPRGGLTLSPWVDFADVTSQSWIDNATHDYLPADLALICAKVRRATSLPHHLRHHAAAPPTATRHLQQRLTPRCRAAALPRRRAAAPPRRRAAAARHCHAH